MLVFDLESDGLLDTVSTVHCLVIKDSVSGEVFRYRPNDIQAGVDFLQSCLDDGRCICGHNIIQFDITVLERLYGLKVTHEQEAQCIDTLVMSRVIYTDLKDRDFTLFRQGILDGKLLGSHSLKAWGLRLGNKKGAYGEETEDAWDKFSEKMLTYCVQDVEVTASLLEKLEKEKLPPDVLRTETQAAWLMWRQEQFGFPFDREKAEILEGTLRARYADLGIILMKIVPQIPDKIFIPKRNNSKRGYVAGVPIQRYKDFNPNSRQQIDWVFINHYKYQPDNEELYVEGRLKINEDTLQFITTDMDAPEELRNLSGVFSEYLMLGKRLGQLTDGKFGWLKMLGEDGNMHGRVSPCGTVSSRASHSSPNVAQVPSVNSPYGKECRALFGAQEGWYQAGVDASGLELRCLAHYLALFDDGAYAHEILNGDIHTANMLAAGLTERNQAKTFIYAFLFGAGDAKIGNIVNGTAADGKRLKKSFLQKTPAIKQLKAALMKTLVAEEYRGRVKTWRRKYLIGLDGRKLNVRSIHSALNLLLQACGGIICKWWIVRLEERLLNLGYDHGKDFRYMAWVHDEVQVQCRTKEIAEVVVKEAQAAMRDAQEHYNVRVQLDTEGKIGRNWSDCH